MFMTQEDFEKLLSNYNEEEDFIITNARDFWEKAPKTKGLIFNKGMHILLKRDALRTLINLDKSYDEDKLEKFCADINMHDKELIKSILKDIK